MEAEESFLQDNRTGFPRAAGSIALRSTEVERALRIYYTAGAVTIA